MPQRVLLVDDHSGFRRMARRLLEGGGFDVVAEAATAAEAVAAAIRLAPDVVLLDVLLPDQNGLLVAERLAALDRPPVVVLISSRLRSELAPLLARADVRGFLQKDDLTLARLRELVG